MGGAAGHVRHIYENKDLTFKDLKEILTSFFTEGRLFFEKTDGFNIAVTVVSGKTKVARNKSTLMKPLSISELTDKFKSNPEVALAFHSGIAAFDNALQGLSFEDRRHFFKDGEVFLNVEIISPQTKNIIDYGDAHKLQVHERWTVSEGIITKRAPSDFYSRIKTQPSPFEVIGPNLLEFKQLVQLNPRRHLVRAYNILDQLREHFKLEESATLKDYYRACWTTLFEGDLKMLKNREKFLRRWAEWSKGSPKERIVAEDVHSDFSAVLKFDKEESANIQKAFEAPLRFIVASTSQIALNGVSNSLSTLTKEEYSEQLFSRVRLQEERNNVKLQIPSAFKQLNPVEGMVFEYKGQQYKATGLFPIFNDFLHLER